MIVFLGFMAEKKLFISEMAAPPNVGTCLTESVAMGERKVLSFFFVWHVKSLSVVRERERERERQREIMKIEL